MAVFFDEVTRYDAPLIQASMMKALDELGIDLSGKQSAFIKMNIVRPATPDWRGWQSLSHHTAKRNQAKVLPAFLLTCSRKSAHYLSRRLEWGLFRTRIPSAPATTTSVAMSRNRPCSAIPGRSARVRARPWRSVMPPSNQQFTR